LGIGEQSVKSHVKALIGKLDATSRTHAVAIAAQRGLINWQQAGAVAAPR
jgi:DNA-binding CsgD family transcriptional regulator